MVLYGPRKFEDMDRDDRVRACSQHCALKWVMSKRMTNQTLRERFRLSGGEERDCVAGHQRCNRLGAGQIGRSRRQLPEICSIPAVLGVTRLFKENAVS